MELNWIITIALILLIAAGYYISYLRFINRGLIDGMQKFEAEVNAKLEKQQEDHNKAIEVFKLVLSRFNIKVHPPKLGVSIYYSSVMNDVFFWYQFYNPLRSTFTNVKLIFIVKENVLNLYSVNCALDKKDKIVIDHVWNDMNRYKIMVPDAEGNYIRVTKENYLNDFITASNALNRYDSRSLQENMSDNPEDKKTG